MTLGELKIALGKLSEEQLKTEACAFEEGTKRYIWIAKVGFGQRERPTLEGVAAEGE